MANADYTLTNLNGATDEARSAVLILTGNQNATYSVIVPAVPKLYMVTNSLNSSAIAYIKPSGGSATQVPNGRTMYLYCTGTAFVALDYVQYAQSLVTGGTITTGAITCSSLTSTGAITSDNRIIGTSINSGSTGAVTLKDATGNPDAVYLQATNNAASTEYASIKFNSNGTITPSGNIVGNLTGTATTVSTTVASGATGTTQAPGTSNTTIATTAFVAAAMAVLYPIGSIYCSTVATNPNTLFGFGTWVAFADARVMIGAGVAYPAGSTGGSADAVIVSHDHNGNTGNNNVDHYHVFTATTGGQSVNHVHTSGVASDTSVFGTSAVSTTDGKSGTIPYGTSPLTNENNVNHTHDISGNTNGQSANHIHGFLTGNANGGVSGTNANMQPFISVYMWNRTA